MVFTQCRVSTAVLLACAALISGCSDKAENAPVPPSPAVNAPAATIPSPIAPLRRPELLDLIAKVSAAAASGATYPQEVGQAAQRRFELKLPFGCAGPDLDTAGSGYTFDGAKKTLRVWVRPEAWSEAEWAQALLGEPAEALEGFWLRRPWITTEGCPPQPGAVGPVEPSPETVGLVQGFTEGSSRVLRRDGRAYEITKRWEGAAPPGEGGFRIVLTGRIAETPASQPIRCRSPHPDRRPVCLVRVEFDRVALETAQGEMLAEWRS